MKQNLSHEDIIRLLKIEKKFLKDEFGVLNIGLFGSYVKGTQRVDSDIDLIVELERASF
jgi:predicted nucleotidyltransferase